MNNFIILALIITQSAIAGEKIIYGEDNRRDIVDVRDPKVRLLAKAIAGRVAKFKISPTRNPDVVSFSHLRTLADPMTYNICSDEKFAKQPLLSDCTGFLVGEDLIATAGHCITDFNTRVLNGSTSDCEDYAWVFDFKKDHKGGYSTQRMPKDNVYTCKKIIKAAYLDARISGLDDDYALIQLDRKVTGRKPLKLRSSGRITRGTSLFVIGHPSGLPMKYADGAKVFETKRTYFSTNLDTFGGNSGSPVFNARTNEVEGILVRGDTDYTLDYKNGESCSRANVCDNNRENCVEEDPAILGEHVSVISRITSAL